MILGETSKTETNCNLEGKAFSIKSSPIAFKILSSKLYSDANMAVVRELLCNAYDSHKACGKQDVPIHVQLPSYLDKNFVIRDYGLGLSKEDVINLYTTFFHSTKADSNDFTGCFGLGSKTPFSYTDAFTVTSYWNGIKYSFIAAKKDGYPNIYCVNEEDTDECNGLQISIPVKDGEAYVFKDNLKNYLKFVDEIIVTADIERPKKILSINNVSLYPSTNSTDHSYYDLEYLYIKQGQSTYKISNDLAKFKDIEALASLSKVADVLIEVPIGTFPVTPNREQLSYSDKVYKDLEKVLKTAISDLLDFADFKSLFKLGQEDIDSISILNWFIKLKYIPEEYKTQIYLSLNSGASTASILTTFDIPNASLMLLDVNTNERHRGRNVRSDEDSIIITLPTPMPPNTYRRILKIGSSCPELADKIIYVLKTSNSYDANVDDTVESITNIVSSLKTIKEVEFNIETIEYKDFIETYSTSSKTKKRTKNTDITSVDKQIRFTRYNISLLADDKTYSVPVAPDTSTVSNIKSWCSNANTIMVVKSDAKSFWDRTIRVFVPSTDPIPKSKNILYEVFLKKLDNSDSITNFNILEISKSNLRLFKEYTIVEKDEVIDFIRNSEYKATIVDSPFNRSELHRFMEALDKINKYTKGSLKNTNLFKQLKILETLLNDPSTVTSNFIKNYTDCKVFTSKFISFIEIIDRNIIIAPKIVKLPISFRKTLKDMYECTSTCNYKQYLKLDKNAILPLFLKRR